MYNAEILTIINELTEALTAIQNSQDPTADINAALASVNILKEDAIGPANTQYTYKCKNMTCGEHRCVLKIPCKLADKTVCMGTGLPGLADFEKTNQDPYTT